MSLSMASKSLSRQKEICPWLSESKFGLQLPHHGTQSEPLSHFIVAANVAAIHDCTFEASPSRASTQLTAGGHPSAERWTL
jgi:hypothetical protein